MTSQVLLQRYINLESPFGWHKDTYAYYVKQAPLQFFPSGMRPTISFTTTRTSKIMGYIPFIGSLIGVKRIYQGGCEHKFFKKTHLHVLSKRSFRWLERGILETIPLIGGLICLITDLVMEILRRPNRPLPLEDQTPCGFCHQCGFCRCGKI